MILTCPQCATGYFVSDADFARGGDEAACAACGARWTPPRITRRGAGDTSDEAQAISAPTLTPPPMANALPRRFRARAVSRRKLRKAAVTGAVWGGALAGLMFVAGAALVFRVQVARAVPGAAAVYAAAGLPVNRVGLVIEAVRAEPGLQDGHATLGVTGTIRNIEDRPVRAPPLRVELYNARGRPVAGQIAGARQDRIPAGGTRRFALAIFDPPMSAYNLQVAFAPEVTGRIAMARPLAAPAAPPAAAPGLRGALIPDAPPAPVVIDAPDPAAPHG